MANNYGFSEEELKPIRTRKRCVYCRKEMDRAHTGKVRSDWATIEHLCEKRPFYKKEGLKIEGLTSCCWSCNSSRGTKKIREWLHEKNIIESNVAEVVQEYIRDHEQ